MPAKIKSYLISVSIVSIATLLFAITFFYFLPQFYFPAFTWVYIFIAVLHALLHSLLLKKINLPPQKFVNFFLLITTIKFFILLLGLVITLFFLKNSVFQIGITVLILFIIYLILEVRILIKNFKK